MDAGAAEPVATEGGEASEAVRADIRVEELEPCRKRVTVTYAPEQVRAALDEQFAELNTKVSFPGFRPGRAPRRMIEARFGAAIRDDVRGKLIEEGFRAAVLGKHIEPIGRPTLPDTDAMPAADQPFTYQFEVLTRPAFELPAWKGLEVKVPAVTVSDADVDQGVEAMRSQEGSLVTSEDPLVPDDVAVVQWTAVIDGADVFRESNAYYRMGSRTLDRVFLEGADEALAGGRPGTVVTARGRCAADDGRPEIAGKEFDVRVEVLEVKRFTPAPLDEEFLRRHDFDDADELRRDVRRRILRARERQRDRLAEERVVEQVVAATTFALPADLVEAEFTQATARHHERAAEEGIPEAEAATAIASAAGSIRTAAEARLRAQFVLDRISEAETVTVGETELVAAVEQIARESGQSAGDVVAHFQEDPGRIEVLRRDLRHAKVRELLRRSAVLVEETATSPGAT